MLKQSIAVITSLLAFVGTSAAENRILMDPPLAEIDKELPTLRLLPPGSELEGVSLPRWNQNNKLLSLITSPYVKIESKTELSGKDIISYLYDKKEKQTSRIYMITARYFYDSGILISKDKTLITDPRLDAVGTGMTFDTSKHVGFMHGPVQTIIKASAMDNKKATSP